MLEIIIGFFKLYLFTQKIVLSYDALSAIYSCLSSRSQKLLYLAIKRGYIQILNNVDRLLEKENENEIVLIDRRGKTQTITYDANAEETQTGRPIDLA
jgi:hypothetical protein